MRSSNALILNSYDLANKIILGEVALFPTDTLPALGASPQYAYKLWDLKHRSYEKPVTSRDSTRLLDVETDIFSSLQKAPFPGHPQ